jgi:hypothetical protein
MIRIKERKSDRSGRTFSVRCDSKGQTGYWSCENVRRSVVIETERAISQRLPVGP